MSVRWSFNVSRQTVFFEYSNIYKHIKMLLENVSDNDDNINRKVQLDIEAFLRSSWIDIIWDKNKMSLSKAGGEGLGYSGFSFLIQYIKKFENIVADIRSKIVKKKKKDKYLPLFELSDVEICVCVFIIIIPLIIGGMEMRRTQLYIRIGESLYNIWLVDLYKKSKAVGNGERVSFNEFKDGLNIDIKKKANLGEALLTEIIGMGDLLVSRIEKKDGSFFKGEYVVYPSETCIAKFEKVFDVVGFKLPMVCEPNKWSIKEYGGYLLNKDWDYNNLIHQGSKNINKTSLSENDCLDVYNQINYMNSVPFKINTFVLDYVLEYGVRDGLILGSLHPKTDKIQDLESWEKNEVKAHNSRYYLEKNILGYCDSL